MGEARITAARMTNQKPTDFRDVLGGGTPGLGLTGNDVAGALALGKATRSQSFAVMAKWVQDESAQDRLFYEIYDRVVKLAAKKKWKVAPGKCWLRKMTRLAIAEHVSPCRCRRCKGRGFLYPPGREAKVCPQCGGSAMGEFMPQSKKAEIIGIPWESWRRKWRWAYAQVLEIIQDEDGKGIAALSRGLREDED